MSTNNHKFTLTTLLTVLALLVLAGARAINASAAQLNLGDDTRKSSEAASGSDDRRSREIEFTGVVQAIDAQTWTISGQQIMVASSAEVKGDPAVGDQVKVHAFVAQDGSLVAREIGPSATPIGDNGNANDDNGNMNGNDNGNANDDNSNINDDNSNINDDNGNANDANGNDNGNTNDDHGNDNGNGNDDHGGRGKGG